MSAGAELSEHSAHRGGNALGREPGGGEGRHASQCIGWPARPKSRTNPHMPRLRFRAPGEGVRLAALLARAVPGSAAKDAGRWVAEGRVRVATWPARDAAQPVEPGSLVELSLDARDATGPPARADGSGRLEGADWVVVERASVEACELFGDSSALAERSLVLGAGAGARGLGVVARDAGAFARLESALADRKSLLTYRALAPTPPWRRGLVIGSPDATPRETRFEVIRERGGVAEIELVPCGGHSEQVRIHLAALGSPALGDPAHGGILVEGGLRLALVALRIPSEGIAIEASEEHLAWPEERTLPAEAERSDAAPVLDVSEATRAALARGHPWILSDAETGDVGRLRPGALARVEARRDAAPILVRVESPGVVAARVWGRGSRVASVRQRIERALERRASLLADGAKETDSYRLLHGEADGFPALFVDRLGPLVRVLLTGRACDLVREAALGILLDRLGRVLGEDPPVVEVVHLRERPRGRLECVRCVRGSLASSPFEGGRVVVRERGLRFVVDPGLGRPETPAPGVGLFLDQRENRERLARLAAGGGRWLNLFAHTGAFSTALLAAGADEVVSVDAAAASLRWLQENLLANGLEARRHRAVSSDARRFLDRLVPRERFAGIVLDPPTAAAGGRRFWSVRRDFAPLVAACLARLEPGGWLLACRNDRAGRGKLREMVAEAAREARVELAAVEPAPPGIDFPHLEGFPEGDPFEGVLARLEG